MAFIKAQKLTYDNDGRITGGSAAIVDTIYGDFGSYHASTLVSPLTDVTKCVYLFRGLRKNFIKTP